MTPSQSPSSTSQLKSRPGRSSPLSLACSKGTQMAESFGLLAGRSKPCQILEYPRSRSATLSESVPLRGRPRARTSMGLFAGRTRGGGGESRYSH